VNAARRLVSILLRPWPSLLACTLLIFVASTVPHPQPPQIGLIVDLPIPLDKIGHGFAYAVLGALVTRAVWPWPARVRLIAAGLVAAVAYGALLEGWQHLIGGDAELGDVAADAVGAAIGGLLVAALLMGRAGSHNGKERPTHGHHGGRAQAP
jgi:VanZ family protein